MEIVRRCQRVHFTLLAMVFPPIFCKSIGARPMSMKAIVLRN